MLQSSLSRSRAGPDPDPPPTRRLRLALLVQLTPKKRGSFEDWIVAMAVEAARRGHRLDVFGVDPIEASIREELLRAGSNWTSTASLLAHRIAGIRRLRQYHVLHLNMFPTRHPVTLMAYAAWPARVAYVDHNSQPERRPGYLERLKSRCIDRLTMPRIARVVGVSDFVRDRARLELRLPEARVTRIYNGVDLVRFSPTRGRIEASGFHIACVANLIPAKGVETLIRAVAALNLPDWRLTVAGEGPDRARLEGVATELQIGGQVVFLGMRNDVQQLLRECDVFVHPAVWTEAFGLTITEAMASGCPVIASRVGAIPEIIEHGESGLLVDPGDVKGLTRALRTLYLDPRLAARLSAEARKRVTDRFSLERCVNTHMDLLEELGGTSRDAAVANTPLSGLDRPMRGSRRAKSFDRHGRTG